MTSQKELYPSSTQSVSEMNRNGQGLTPVNGNNFLSNLLFSWCFEFLRKKYDHQLKSYDVPGITKDQATQRKARAFEMEWNKCKCQGSASLLSAILAIEKWQILQLITISLVSYSLYLSYPVLIYFDIEYVSKGEQVISTSVWLFLLTTLGLLVFNIINIYEKYRIHYFGANLSATINLVIFKKALSVPLLATTRFTEADIINLSQIDAENLNQFGAKVVFVIFGLIEVAAELTILYFFIGLLLLIPLGVMVVINLANFKIGAITVGYSQTILKKKDDRINASEEMLSTIKNIKTNTHEKFFYKKINREREEELRALKGKGLLESILVLLCNLANPIMLSAIFITMHISGVQITAAKVFVTISVARIFQYTAQMMPRSIAEIVNIYNSILRIQQFLLAEEISEKGYNHIQSSNNDNSIQIKNGNFYTESVNKTLKQTSEQIPENASTLLLNNINVTIKRGQLYMVFGDTGSGKSTLLLSILNQMKKSGSSSVKIEGKIAYVSQRPWTMCDSLLNNVLFASSIDQERLQKVLTAACLSEDIAILPNGVRTSLGENGINLSGGQKTRVALGRALYSNADIYLFDDVLSAVDVHVAERILREAIGEMLRGKTVVLVTHAAKFAHFADRIILMDQGTIIAEGDYATISKSKEFENIKIKEKQNENKIDDEKGLIEKNENQMQANKFYSQQIPNNSTNKILIEQQLSNNIIVNEDSEIGEVKMSILQKYIELNGGYYWFFFVIIGSFLGYGCLQTASAIFIEEWSDSDGSDERSLYYFVGFALASMLFMFFQTYALVISSINQGKTVHNSIVKQLLYSSYTEFFNRVPKGRILNRLGKDIRQLDEIVGLGFSSCLLYFVQFLSGVILMVYSSSAFLLIPTFVVCVIFYGIRRLFVNCYHQVIRLEKVANSPVITGFTTMISGLTTIRAYQQQHFFLEAHAKNLDENKKMTFNKCGLECLFELAMTILIFVLNASCIGYVMFSNSSTSSSFGLLLISMVLANQEIYDVFKEYTGFEGNMICLERLYQFMSLPVEPAYVQYCGEEWKGEQEELPRVISLGGIEFRAASIRYRKDLPNIVNDLNISITPGEKVGIVGRTGSGKSTLFNALLRIIDLSQGTILIDGRDITEMSVKSLRSEITVIDQQPVLVEGTFRDNLDALCKHSDDELMCVLKECNLWSLVEARGGLEGKIQRNGLSAGEKQLLCVCRALLRDTHIVLMDEATANIDSKNDALLQGILAEKMRSKTVLTIAHRLSTLEDYDKIMVMEDGELIEFGPPEVLYEKKGLFYEMVESVKYQTRK